MCRMEKICIGGRRVYVLEDERCRDARFFALTEEQVRLLEYLNREFPCFSDFSFRPIDEIDIECL